MGNTTKEIYYSPWIDAKDTIFQQKWEEDNIWNADKVFKIYKIDGGYGWYREIPAGYSEYTYDPEVIGFEYIGNDLDYFYNLVMDADARSNIDFEHFLEKVSKIAPKDYAKYKINATLEIENE